MITLQNLSAKCACSSGARITLSAARDLSASDVTCYAIMLPGESAPLFNAYPGF